MVGLLTQMEELIVLAPIAATTTLATLIYVGGILASISIFLTIITYLTSKYVWLKLI